MPPPHSHRAVPAAILATGMVAAAAILLTAADTATPPTTATIPNLGGIAGTPDDPANRQAWTPNGH